MVTVTENK